MNYYALLGLGAIDTTGIRSRLSGFFAGIECIGMTVSDGVSAGPVEQRPECWPDLDAFGGLAFVVDSLGLNAPDDAHEFGALANYTAWNPSDGWAHARLGKMFSQPPNSDLTRADKEFLTADSLGFREKWMYEKWDSVRTLRGDDIGAAAVLKCARLAVGPGVGVLPVAPIIQQGRPHDEHVRTGPRPKHCGNGFPWPDADSARRATARARQ
jgi:hypothetical protein